MTVMPFIPKENQELPDHYGMKVYYLNGTTEEFEVASHTVIDKVYERTQEGRRLIGPSSVPTLEFVTKDDVWSQIPYTSIRRMEFDKRFSKILALAKEPKK
jgi:hypothetical protein